MLTKLSSIWSCLEPACRAKSQHNIFSERVEQFIYLRTTLTNKNSIHEEIKSRMKGKVIIRAESFVKFAAQKYIGTSNYGHSN
jgi:hypothetical protein